MSDNGIKIYKKISKRKSKKSQTQKLDKTLLNLKWIKKLKKTTVKKKDTPIFIKKELEGEEMLENAKIHRQANRPLKQIKEFDDLTKFCQCCYNPMKDQIHLTNFNFCDSTDEFTVFGRGISLYFSYIKYSIFILLFSFIVLSLPNILISNKCTEEIINLCNTLFSKEGENINMTLPFCNGFIDNKKEKNNNQIIALFKFNSMNLKQYKDIYFYITSNKNNNIDRILVNYHLIYFIGLLTLFIIHSLYILLSFNIMKQYDMSVTSPSDYAVIITNLKSAFEIFFDEVNKINQIIKNKIEKSNLLRNNFIAQEDVNFSKKIFRRFQEIGLENFDRDKEINTYKGFNEFIKNKICGNENGEQYKIYQINICYKINEFNSIKEKIKQKNNEIYIAKNDPEQLKKNLNLNKSQEDYKYFYYPLDIFDLYICPFTLYEKSSKISEILNAKKKLEDKLKSILKDTENLTRENFSGVVFTIFNSMKEKDKFIQTHKKNFIMKLINSLSNLKYYICPCCINHSKLKEYFLKHNISVEEAPEPEDIIFENLEFSRYQRLSRVLFAYFISFILIAICFFIILYLNNIQIKQSQTEEGNSILNRYGVSISISLIIALINSIFQNLLVFLTKIEKQISMTNYFLSYSIKLTILTFISSVIIPFLTSNYYKAQLNHDILITNCFTMFLSNSFLIPITWTINFDFILKKLRMYIITKKNKRLPQNELNKLYELLDMDIASKYSYITRTLFMSFFYLPIFPLGIPICFLGFIFSYFLEKYNFIKKYKKPLMLNSKIYEVYSNYFVIIFFFASLGNYFFLKNVFDNYIWLYINIFLFSALTILPYYNLLKIDFIEINEADIKEGELYEDYFYNFFHDYERNNPITKKEGIKHFLDKLLEKVLITKNDYDTILQNYEEMNLLEIYYKSKLHFGYNLLKRAFNGIKKVNKTKNNKNNLFNGKKVKGKKGRKSVINKNGLSLNLNKQNKIIKKERKSVIYNNQRIDRIKIKKNIIKPDSISNRKLMYSGRKTIENEENDDIMNINIKSNLKK